MKQTRYGTIVKIMVLLLMVLVLPACVEKAENFDEMEQALLDNYSTPFQERAVLQYGKDAKVVDIEAETISSSDAIWPTTYVGLSGNLLGTIQLGEERFEAIYLYKQGEIYSKRNADKIKQSAVQLFTDMGIDVVYIILRARFLPDSAVDFKYVLENENPVFVSMLVTTDLSDYSVEDFSWVSSYGDDKYQSGITFIQLNDPTRLEEISRSWENGDIRFRPIFGIYKEESDEYIDLFRHYDVGSYLYVQKSLEKDWLLHYKNEKVTSMYQAFSELGMDVVVIDSNESLEKYPLTDTTQPFKSMLADDYMTHLKVYVKNDLSAYSAEAFAALLLDGETDYRGRITFIELTAASTFVSLRHFWSEGRFDFSAKSPEVCDEEYSYYDDIFGRLDIAASLYVEKLDDKVKIVYQNKDGIISEDTLE